MLSETDDLDKSVPLPPKKKKTDEPLEALVAAVNQPIGKKHYVNDKMFLHCHEIRFYCSDRKRRR